MAVADVKGASRNLIRTSVPNLISGVSQQADSFKLTTQAVEQINAVSSVVDGLIKRPSTYLLKDISYNFNTGENPFYPYTNNNTLPVYPKLNPIKYFIISTDEINDYFAVFLNNPATNEKSLKVFDINGNEKNVIYQGGNKTIINNYLSGLTTETLGSSIKTLSIADYTFVLNTTKITEISQESSPRATAGIGGTGVYQGMVVVKTGYTGHSEQEPEGDISWSIKIVGTNNVVYATASGSSDAWNLPTESTGGMPTTIANDIATKLNAGIVNNFGTNGRIAVAGSNVIIQNSSLDFKIIVDDGYAGSIFYSIKDNVQSFTDLPVVAPHKFITKVTGLPDSSGDEYYVEHLSNYTGEFLVGSANSSPVGIFAVNEGPWQETRASGIQYKINPSSMPHAIVKLDSNNFLFTTLNSSNT